MRLSELVAFGNKQSRCPTRGGSAARRQNARKVAYLPHFFRAELLPNCLASAAKSQRVAENQHREMILCPSSLLGRATKDENRDSCQARISRGLPFLAYAFLSRPNWWRSDVEDFLLAEQPDVDVRRSMIMVVTIVLAAGSFALRGFSQDRGSASRNLPTQHHASDRADLSVPASATRMREGAKLTDYVGKFEVTGERITFYPSAGGEPLRALENLTLERVAHELAGIRREREWSVTGVVTEFQGGNYLLVTRAILKLSSDAAERPAAGEPPAAPRSSR